MELVQGVELRGLIGAPELLENEEKIRKISAELVCALVHIHSKGILHRDLNPGNILLTEMGLKLVDFGLAIQLSKDGRTYTVAGTPEYMAPEIFTEQGHNYEVDWWALGILLYEMIHGYTPWIRKQGPNL